MIIKEEPLSSSDYFIIMRILFDNIRNMSKQQRIAYSHYGDSLWTSYVLYRSYKNGIEIRSEIPHIMLNTFQNTIRSNEFMIARLTEKQINKNCTNSGKFIADIFEAIIGFLALEKPHLLNTHLTFCFDWFSESYFASNAGLDRLRDQVALLEIRGA